MNKSELITKIANSTGFTKVDVSKVVDGMISAITNELKKKGEVRLVGFGTFLVSKRKATTGRNPRTGDVIKIPASNQPKFRAGQGLKDAVNK